MSTEPTDDQITQYMAENKIEYYEAREILRERAYKEQYGMMKPPGQSWGDFWKSY